MKLHFATGERQAGGANTRCGLRIVERGKTTTARRAVTCKRCARFIELDRQVPPAARKPSRRERPRIF